ncbi:hypothetical protein A8139_20625 [Marinomonas primoryensis]|uniref:Uncharacterized protein n=1 Tax=Marinomonas primoryensis TaxID=178399 RepID=A0A2Z4PYD4_9GAMM|nr:hypothetical protein [Marinomonas primoryensis]AWY02074.1 hypothetical protein A8139_20625 [Marinomonas primoryensis]
MIWIYALIVHSILPSGFLVLWQSINLLFVIFFGAKSNLVDGCFSYKPDIFEKSNMYDYVWIYWKNCLRYLFGIERPPMPWYAKINTIFCALGILASAWAMIIVTIDSNFYPFIDGWTDIVAADGRFGF